MSDSHEWDDYEAAKLRLEAAAISDPDAHPPGMACVERGDILILLRGMAMREADCDSASQYQWAQRKAARNMLKEAHNIHDKAWAHGIARAADWNAFVAAAAALEHQFPG